MRKPAKPRADVEVRVLDNPQPGFWMVRMGKDCPEVPARIWFERHTDHGTPEPWANAETRILGIFAEIAGEAAKVEAVWHTRGKPITEKEFAFQMANLRWAKTYAPADPIANHRERVVMRAIPLPF